MTCTLTTVVKPTPITGGGVNMAVYSFAFDTVYPTGGEAIDVSADFSHVVAVWAGGNDTLADNGRIFAPLFTYTDTPTSSNTLITVWCNYNPAGTGSADRVHKESIETATKNLSAIGAFQIVVLGR